MKEVNEDYRNIVEILQQRKDDKGIYFIYSQKEKYITYRDLYQKSLSLLYYLQKEGIQPGEEVIFQLADPYNFAISFWACILGKIIPVPVTLGRTEGDKNKLFKVWNLLNSPHLLTSSRIKELMVGSKKPVNPAMKELLAKTMLVDNYQLNGQQGEIYQAAPDDIAFIQFSSGSTGDPKGIVLTHKNILTNIIDLANHATITSQDSFLGWMPLTHDLGLIGWHLTPLLTNSNQYHMPTEVFIKDPLIWFDKTSQHRVTTLASPNFGYKHLLRYFDEERAEEWDLSSVRIIFNGAEPISAEIAQHFLDKMSRYGLKEEPMTPAYGIAEGTLGISFDLPENKFISYSLDRQSLTYKEEIRLIDKDDDDATIFVDCGKVVDNCQVRIADKENNTLPENTIGHIQFKGDNVTRGYYNNAEATEKAFTSDGWFDSGDLGFMRDGRLTITGRVKEIIFANGQNYYPHDLEGVASELEGIYTEQLAFCGVPDPKEKSDQIICFVLVEDKLEAFKPLLGKLQQYVNEKTGLEIDLVIPVKEFPRTGSGKVQRYKLVQLYQQGQFDHVIESLQDDLKIEREKRQILSPTNDIEKRLVEICSQILEVDRLGITDNFFQLGGNSLKGAAILSQIFREFQVEIPLGTFFANPTVRNLAVIIEETDESIYQSIPVAEEEEYYPVSSAQRRLYLSHQLEDEHLGYNLPYLLKIDGELDIEQLRLALDQLITRHDSLRTSFHLIDGQPMQKVHKTVDFQMDYREPSDQEELDNYISGFIKTFKLNQPPLFRAALVKDNDTYLFLFDMHHIISDGTSMVQFINQLFDIYQGKEVPDLEIQYKDYAIWQNQQLASEELKSQEEYWLEEFKEGSPVLNLPTDYQRPPVFDTRGQTYRFELDQQLTDKIHQFNIEQDTTLFMTLLAAYQILLAKYSHQEDIVVGTATTGRNHPQLNDIIGMFVNTIPLRNQPEGEKRFVDYLTEVKEKALWAFENQDFQFDSLVERLGLRRNSDRNPLFDVVFVLQHADIEPTQIGNLQITPEPFDKGAITFDLALNVFEKETNLSFEMEYCRALFKESTIARMMGHYQYILDQIVDNREIRINDIRTVSREEEQLLENFNHSQVEYEADKYIYQLFEEQVTETPDKPALYYKGQEISYREINEKANQLARLLRKKGIGPEKLVAIMSHTSFELIIGIMAILKSGGGYVPIDPTYPEDRINYMLEDSGAEMLLTRREYIQEVDVQKEIIDLDNESSYRGDSSNLPVNHQQDNLAYIIYTSGSTGKPKGVPIEHAGLYKSMIWSVEQYPLTTENTALQVLSFSFDGSLLSFFTPFLQGTPVVLVREEQVTDLLAIKRLIREYQIDFFLCIPSWFNSLLDYLDDEELSYLGIITLAGEKTTKQIIDKYKARNCKFELVNEYGPTENSIITTYLRNMQTEEKITIGRPVSNNKVYIVDQEMNLVPIGVPGELCISGEKLARGYLNRPELTAEKFVQNPFDSQGRLYKTGDKAKWTEDGKIDFLGRIDHQVKIRGFRIETGEIERRLLSYGTIDQVVVKAIEDQLGNNSLAAYIIAEDNPEIKEIKNYLAEELPEYMIPSHLIFLDDLPISPTGKIDIKALPHPKTRAGISNYRPPRTGQEEKLVTIWRQVLGIERVGIEDNFFDLGGDSIKGIQIISRAHQVGLRLTVKDIFQHKTISGIAENVELKRSEIKISQEEVTGQVLLTPIQHWFFEQDFEYPGYWNQTNLFRLPADLDIERLEEALLVLVEHHDALRMSYNLSEQGVEQINRRVDQVDFSLIQKNLSNYDTGEQNKKIEELAVQIQKDLDLEEDLLFKAILFNLGQNGYQLLIPVHHLVIDGVSWRILIEDLEKLYTSYPEVELPLKTTSYQEWSKRLNQYANETPIDINYWEELSDRELDSLVEFGLKDNYLCDHQNLVGKLEREETEQLLKKVNWAYGTEINDILLTALVYTTEQILGKSEILVNLENHGREEIFTDIDLSRTIGWFTSTYPVLLEKNGGLRETIVEIKEKLRQIPNNGLNYGLAAYLNRDNRLRAIKPQIIFNYLGQFNELNDSANSLILNSHFINGFYSQNHHPTLLDINSMVMGGELTLNFDYNQKALPTEVMEQFKENYLSNLKLIIDHCLNIEEKVYTPSDFGVEDEIGIDGLQLLNQEYSLDEVSINKTTSMQQGMLFHSLYDRDGLNYYQQNAFYLEGEVNLDSFKEAWQQVINKHQIFRTHFRWRESNRPLAIVVEEKKAEINLEDISDIPVAEQTDYIQTFKKKELEKRFDYETGQLNRLGLLKLAEDKYLVCWTFHHLLLDGWSGQTVLGDLFSIYHSLVNNDPICRQSGPQYSAYLNWLQDQNQQRGYQFWEGYLEELETPTLLSPIESSKKDHLIKKGKTRDIAIDSRLTEKINDFCRREKITTNAFIQTCWGILLQKYCGTDVSCFGMTSSNRPPEIDGVEEIVGLMINTLPVIVKAESGQSIKEMLDQVNQDLVEIRDYGYNSLTEIQKKTQLSADSRFFDSVIIFENYPFNSAITELELGFEISLESIFELTNYDLTLTVFNGAILSLDQIMIKLVYNTELFNQSWIESLEENFKKVIRGILNNSGSHVDQIELDIPSTNNMMEVAATTEEKESQSAQTEKEKRLVTILTDILEIDSMGIDDNFFELGGDSLKAVELVSRIYREMNVELALKEIFGRPTVRELARLI